MRTVWRKEIYASARFDISDIGHVLPSTWASNMAKIKSFTPIPKSKMVITPLSQPKVRMIKTKVYAIPPIFIIALFRITSLPIQYWPKTKTGLRTTPRQRRQGTSVYRIFPISSDPLGWYRIVGSRWILINRFVHPVGYRQTNVQKFGCKASRR